MKKIIYTATLITLASCGTGMSEDEIAQIGIAPCRKPAPFIKQLGFDANRSAFSTTQKNVRGVVLIEAPIKQNDTTFRIHQDSSWKKFGYCGSLTTDENGNTYTVSIPVVNTLDVPVSEMNKILRVDAITGKLEIFVELPKPNITSDVVQYGILGLYFDCHGKKLYVSSVSGSTRESEKGTIYVIDIATKKIIDELKGFDAMGLFVSGSNAEKRLYFGSARNSNIYSVELSKEGKFVNKNKVSTDFSLDNLGPRGTDKARRIRCDKAGNLIVNGIEFNFSLAAEGDKPETVYQFDYDETEKKWVFGKILH